MMTTKFIKISKSELFSEARQETGSLEISIDDLQEYESERQKPKTTNISKLQRMIQKMKKFEDRFQMFQVLY